MGHLKGGWLLCGLMTACAPGALFAAEAPVQSAGDVATATAQEIVVTAQRREETLTKVPLSVSALTRNTLDAGGIRQIGDIRLATPGYTVSTQGGFTQMFIRGIGNQIYIADPSVATFIDDVPRNYGNMIPDLTNVERVEVLKGAQGGLYGRNATGGVINIITRQPSDNFEARARVSYGERATLEASTFVNLPVNDKVAVNLSVTRRSHDAYVRNLAQPNPYPAGTNIGGLDLNSVAQPGPLQNQDLWALDAKARIRLTDRLKVTLGGDYSVKDDTDGNSLVQNDPQTLYAFYKSFAPLFGLTALPGPFPTGGHGRFETYDGVNSAAGIRSYGGYVRIDDEEPAVTLTSISSLRRNEYHFYDDSTAAPVPLITAETHSYRNTFYQELRAVSNGAGPLKFIAGGSYSHDDFDLDVVVKYFGVLPGGTALSTTKTDAYSVYGQLSYDLTSKLTLTGSLRYVGESKSVAFRDPVEEASLTSHKVLPSATLSYDLGDGTTYVRYAKGFKSGGVNANSPPALFAGGAGFTFEPEEVDTYEAGYKVALLDRRLQLTSAVFYNHYKNLQVAASAYNPAILIALVNAGSARTYGAEGSVTYALSHSLTLSANLGYLDARYQSFALANPDAPHSGLVPFDYSGQRMPLAPKWQGSLSLALDQPLDRLRVVGNLLYAYTSALNFAASLSPTTEQPAYSLLNLRIGLARLDDRLGVYVFANNLTNTYYTTYGTQSAATGTLLTIGSPRVVGVTVEAKY